MTIKYPILKTLEFYKYLLKKFQVKYLQCSSTLNSQLYMKSRLKTNCKYQSTQDVSAVQLVRRPLIKRKAMGNSFEFSFLFFVGFFFVFFFVCLFFWASQLVSLPQFFFRVCLFRILAGMVNKFHHEAYPSSVMRRTLRSCLCSGSAGRSTAIDQ